MFSTESFIVSGLTFRSLIHFEFLFVYGVSSVQFSRSVMSNSLRSHESQHTRPPCPSPSPGVHSNSHPSSLWCHSAISSCVVPFSCPQSLPVSESFPMSQLFTWGGQSTGVSALASFLPKNTQGWSPLEWTGWTSLQSIGSVLISFFYMELSSFPSTAYWRGCLCPIVYSSCLCQKTRCPKVQVFISGLSILFHWSIFLFLHQYHTVLMTVACSIIWNQEGWFLQFYSSFSRLLWLFKVFGVSIWIEKFFVLVLWKMPLVIW